MLIFCSCLLLERNSLEAKGDGKIGGDSKSVRPLLCITAWYCQIHAPGFVFWLLKKIVKDFYITYQDCGGNICRAYSSDSKKIEGMKYFFRNKRTEWNRWMALVFGLFDLAVWKTYSKQWKMCWTHWALTRCIQLDLPPPPSQPV